MSLLGRPGVRPWPQAASPLWSGIPARTPFTPSESPSPPAVGTTLYALDLFLLPGRRHVTRARTTTSTRATTAPALAAPDGTPARPVLPVPPARCTSPIGQTPAYRWW